MKNSLTEREKWLVKKGLDAGKYYTDIDTWLSEVISDAGHIVEQALAHDAPDDWISVDERLPEYLESVLCYSEDLGKVYEAYYQPQTGCFHTNMVEAYPNVTHWMPLPEPPEVSDD